MTLIVVAKGTQIAAAVSSIALARRRGEHLPAAIALVVLAAIGIARGPVGSAITSPGEILYYVDGAAELGTYATMAGLAMAVAVTKDMRRRAFALAFLAWAVGSIVLGILSPIGQQLHRFYFGADLVGLCVSAAALVRWGQRLTAAKLSPDSASVVALGLVALDGAILLAPFSPWRADVYASDFAGIQVIIAMFFATFTIVQVVVWRYSSRGSASGRP
jgi:hypothetical protein